MQANAEPVPLLHLKPHAYPPIRIRKRPPQNRGHAKGCWEYRPNTVVLELVITGSSSIAFCGWNLNLHLVTIVWPTQVLTQPRQASDGYRLRCRIRDQASDALSSSASSSTNET